MQLLGSPSTQTVGTSDLLETLQDIAQNVQIHSNFCISHPSYKPLELPSEVVSRFQRIPPELQTKYLNLQLQSFLYGIYYNGSMRSALALQSDTSSHVHHQDLENNTFLGIDLKFYDRLHESNQGAGYFDSGWKILRQESDGSLAVTKGGLTLHIERDRHLHPSQQLATIEDLVTLRMPRNLMQNGFYVAVGDAGYDRPNPLDDQSTTVRIYFNLSPEGAVAVMGSLTQRLNECFIPFSFKVLYNPANYDRYDSGVLYISKKQYSAVCQVLERTYADNQSHFHPESPLFTKQLEPGLAIAEEPDRKFTTQESFGMNRCQIVANGLLAAWSNHENTPDARLAAILRSFTIAEIDLEQPFLNPNAQDVYTWKGLTNHRSL